MENKQETNETLAIIMSGVKSIVTHFKIDKRKKPGDDPAAEQDEESKEAKMLNDIAATVEKIESKKGFTEEQVNVLGQVAGSSIKSILAKDDEKHAEVKQRFDNLDKKFAEPWKSTIRREYAIAVDFKNPKVVKTIIVMVVVIIISVGFNIHQVYKNSDLRDNDLKYRYIKKEGGIDADGILGIEAFFGYNREASEVRNLRRTVEQYEQAVAEQAERTEQARLNAIKAEQLRQEAEALKNKR